jgi:thymidylate synthase
VKYYEEDTINTYYPLVCNDLMTMGKVTKPRDLETREIHPTSVVINSPRQRLVTSFGRMINLPFVLAEVVQILAGKNDAQALRHYNTRIVEIAGDPVGDGGRKEPGWQDKVTRFNGAYGERLRGFSLGGATVDQLEHVIETLKRDPDSRQASIVLSHPMWDNYMHATRDRACNVYAHAMIRDGQLDWMQVMRSNDVTLGLPYNFVQWLHVMEYVACRLGIGMGQYTLIQDSLHVYQDKYGECTSVKPFDLYAYRKNRRLLDMPPYNDKKFHENVVQWEEWIRTGGTTPLVRAEDENDNYWYQVVCVFNSFSAFKNGRDEMAFKLLPSNWELRYPLLRNYVSWRWHKPDYESYAKIAIEELEAFLGYKAGRWLGMMVYA